MGGRKKEKDAISDPSKFQRRSHSFKRSSIRKSGRRPLRSSNEDSLAGIRRNGEGSVSQSGLLKCEDEGICRERNIGETAEVNCGRLSILSPNNGKDKGIQERLYESRMRIQEVPQIGRKERVERICRLMSNSDSPDGEGQGRTDDVADISNRRQQRPSGHSPPIFPPYVDESLPEQMSEDDFELRAEEDSDAEYEDFPVKLTSSNSLRGSKKSASKNFFGSDSPAEWKEKMNADGKALERIALPITHPIVDCSLNMNHVHPDHREDEAQLEEGFGSEILLDSGFYQNSQVPPHPKQTSTGSRSSCYLDTMESGTVPGIPSLSRSNEGNYESGGSGIIANPLFKFPEETPRSFWWAHQKPGSTYTASSGASKDSGFSLGMNWASGLAKVFRRKGTLSGPVLSVSREGYFQRTNLRRSSGRRPKYAIRSSIRKSGANRRRVIASKKSLPGAIPSPVGRSPAESRSDTRCSQLSLSDNQLYHIKRSGVEDIGGTHDKVSFVAPERRKPGYRRKPPIRSNDAGKSCSGLRFDEIEIRLPRLKCELDPINNVLITKYPQTSSPWVGSGIGTPHQTDFPGFTFEEVGIEGEMVELVSDGDSKEEEVESDTNLENLTAEGILRSKGMMKRKDSSGRRSNRSDRTLAKSGGSLSRRSNRKLNGNSKLSSNFILPRPSFKLGKRFYLIELVSRN